MTGPPRGPIIVDTNVFGARLRRGTYNLAARYDPLLVGRGVVISFQSVAELEYGAIVAGWGTARRRHVARLIDEARTVWPGRELTHRCAQLRAACHVSGHPLAHPVHNGDLWIAATALHLGLPLVSDDGIFDGVPGLQRERA